MQKIKMRLRGKSRVSITAFLERSSDASRPAMLILPGGAFLFTAPSEGETVAYRFLREGYQCFVLDYSTHSNMRRNERFMPQMGEIAECLAIIKENSAEWNVDPRRVCMMGFSAGGNLAASYAAKWKDRTIYDQYLEMCNEDNCEPVWDGTPVSANCMILCYPLLDHVDSAEWMKRKKADRLTDAEMATEEDKMKRLSYRSLLGAENPDTEMLSRASAIGSINSDIPATFIWHTYEDEMVNPMQSIRYAAGLYEAGVSCELHIFDRGKHALSLAGEDGGHRDEPASQWVRLALSWLERNNN